MSKNKAIKRLSEEVRRRGGILSIPEDAPPEVVRAMLEEMMHCPLCEELKQKAKPSFGH